MEHTILQFFTKRRGQSFTRLNVEYDTRLVETQAVLDTLVSKGKLLKIGPVSGGVTLYTLPDEVQGNARAPVLTIEIN